METKKHTAMELLNLYDKASLIKMAKEAAFIDDNNWVREGSMVRHFIANIQDNASDGYGRSDELIGRTSTLALDTIKRYVLIDFVERSLYENHQEN